MSLPTSNKKGSRIIVTTRDVGLAKICTSDSFIYNLEPLKEEHAIDLLLRKMGKTRVDIENNEKLKALVKQLVKKCGYLPLAILTIGALFATKHESKWEKLYIHLPSELETNQSLEALRKMVTLSYSHLPSHLKPCFLYLSIFPEDFEIRRKRLVNRWIAEGLVRSQVGMNIEDVGKSYFNELISRSMIQPSKVSFEGIAKRCRVHDIMRDVIVSLSREEEFAYISGDNIPCLVEGHFRHVAYHGRMFSTIQMDWGRVRSLTVFGDRHVEHAPSLCSPELRMLRALDLECADFAVTQKDISNIGLLRHLKYVNIRCSQESASIYALPRSIGKLKGLQALEVTDSCISTLPTEICKLKSLRVLCCNKKMYYRFFDPSKPRKCLVELLRLQMTFTDLVGSEERNKMIAELHMAYSSCWSKTDGVKVPRGIDNLKELQILEIVDIKRTSNKAVKELGRVRKLRTLSVNTEGATEKKCMTLCKAIQKLSSLSSLKIDAGYFGTVEWLDSISSPPLLRKLTLWGRIGDKVDWFRNLTQLVKLLLAYSQLEEGKAVEVLGALPNLVLLGLAWDAYAGKELVFIQGTFRNLRKLYIWESTHLREIRFQPDTSPQMERIEIAGCMLELGINGIKHLRKLKEIYLSYGSKVARLGMLQCEVSGHSSAPVLRLWGDPSDHDLDDAECCDEYFDASEFFPLPDQDGEGSKSITTIGMDS